MRLVAFLAAIAVFALLVVRAAGPEGVDERLARYRNLGKAFYENPTTQNEAVEEFRKALALAPNSARERLNYGLALLRAGKTAEGIAELRKVQKQDPSIPHTWFNLGIAYKKAGEQDTAIQQFEQMVKLVPDEPISHYNLGSLYRLAGKTDDAIREFRTAAKLDPTLAAPHFQLFNLLRTSGHQDEAKPELAIFQKLKKQQEGAAIPEDVEWCMYAEIYDVMTDTPAQDKVAILEQVPQLQSQTRWKSWSTMITITISTASCSDPSRC
jgi:tetratricopeptide (TPR) repeat protein